MGPWRVLTGLWKAVRSLDLRDWHVYGGFALAAVGGMFLSAPWTCVALGLALAGLGLLVRERKERT
jgi:hypothetical protein